MACPTGSGEDLDLEPTPDTKGTATVPSRPAPGGAGIPGIPPGGGRRAGLGPFVTFMEYERPDGLGAQWDSRRHRKQPRPGAGDVHGTGGVDVNSTWWAPGIRGWWIAILFMVGSGLFALGALPGYAGTVGTRADSVTFFIGSLFFTSAGFLQYRKSVDTGPGGRPHGWGRVFADRPRQIDWWASGVQLIGTLYFNVSTGTAMKVDLTGQAAHQHVWRPDAFGSICFLVASGLAWSEVCHGWWAWSPSRFSWWITALNLWAPSPSECQR